MNINIGIKQPTRRYQYCNTSQILIFDGYLKVWQSLYTQVIIWVTTILNHINTRVILPRYEDSCMVYRPEWYQKQKYCQILMSYWYQKLWNPHLDTRMVSKEDHTRPMLVDTYLRYLGRLTSKKLSKSKAARFKSQRKSRRMNVKYILAAASKLGCSSTSPGRPAPSSACRA